MLLCAAAAIAHGQAQQIKDQKKQARRDRISKLAKEEEEGTLVYSKQSAFGFKANTDGWGLFYEHGKYKTVTKTGLWWLEFGEHKNTKEDKQSFTDPTGNFQIGNPFIYGKINNFYLLKFGLGQQTLIGGKGNKNGVAITAIYGGGVSLGYLKPYYLSVAQDGQLKDIKYTDSTASDFLNPLAIVGGSSFGKGWGEGKLVPGAHAKAALRFDYGRYNELLSALEVGVNAEYYTKDMRLMVGIPNKQFFFNAYIALVFGKRK